MNSAEPQYHVYIVRVWREHTSHAGQDSWRFTLSTPSVSKRLGFTDLAAMCDALFDELTTIIAYQQAVECDDHDNEPGV